MGMMEEIRERARAEAELLPPSLALLKSTEKQVCDLHKKLNSAMEQIEAQQEQLNKLLKMVNAIGLMLKKQQQAQPRKEKSKWTSWIS
ncbi:MAG: hypothetical protein BroJett006_27350 [Betaproteobacteria bacterium]|nr:MAG: hypothetical protein BroJett006_27350 [Betaproteobacteria bacterium]